MPPLPPKSALTRAPLPTLARKGRGAASNPAIRYETLSAEPFDDGWGALDQDVAEAPAPRTELTRETSHSALTYNESPDLGFDRSLNPYRGCEHGCVYCYARPAHAYVGLSPGLDFETRILFKPDMPARLEAELSRPGYVPRPVALGANTDAYQPVERTLRITRALLEVLDRFHHPVTIVTKSAGILRDLDILSRMAARNLVRVALSVTTLDPRLARTLEPRAATPPRRLQAIRELAAAGVPTSVLMAPLIPALNDHEIEAVLEAGAGAGAASGGYVLLRLPLEIAALVEEWLRQHAPARADHVLSLVRQTRGGALYRSGFGERQVGTGPYAALLAQRFALALRRFGLDRRRGGTAKLDCGQFRVPEGAREGTGQLRLI
ncbi:MAG: PA0069 family radical SAM protein [Acetobacteraceae bacterium]|nr:PA0069 family radical SAM protein [Acetobacteraceae bacterium]